MNPSQETPTPAGNPAIDFVLVQHFAQMVDEYYPRALAAENAAGIAQHQVHVLSREVDALTHLLEIATARLAHMDRFIIQSTTFTQNVIAAIPDIDNEDVRVTEFNRLINEYNRDHPIDLTTDEELE